MATGFLPNLLAFVLQTCNNRDVRTTSQGKPVRQKQAIFIPAARKDLKKFPVEVRADVGAALYQAELGGKSPLAKVMKGFSGASVIEIVSDHRTDTYRAVYTVKFERAIVVLHCFQKKAKHGIATPQPDIDLIKQRLKEAERVYEIWLQEQA